MVLKNWKISKNVKNFNKCAGLPSTNKILFYGQINHKVSDSLFTFNRYEEVEKRDNFSGRIKEFV